MFGKTKRIKEYTAQKTAIKKLQTDVTKLKNFGMPVCAALQYLPKNTLCNIHFQKIANNSYRKITVKSAMHKLSSKENLARVKRIQLDFDYNGSKEPAPICILEIPCHE